MFGSGLSSLAQERKASKQNKSKLKTGDTPLKSGERELAEGSGSALGTGKVYTPNHYLCPSLLFELSVRIYDVSFARIYQYMHSNTTLPVEIYHS